MIMVQMLLTGNGYWEGDARIYGFNQIPGMFVFYKRSGCIPLTINNVRARIITCMWAPLTRYGDDPNLECVELIDDQDEERTKFYREII